MNKDYLFDLRNARRDCGFTQADVAHLCGADAATISRLERGERLPSLQETMLLSLIYGRSFEALFAEMMETAKADLSLRLTTLPPVAAETCQNQNRQASLDSLKEFVSPEPEYEF